MMMLRDYKDEDALIIAGWIGSEEELYKWSADGTREPDDEG